MTIEKSSGDVFRDLGFSESETVVLHLVSELLIKTDAVIALLTEIRDALVPPPPPPDDWCGHPEQERTDLGSMGEEEWICRACRFHFGPVKKEKR